MTGLHLEIAEVDFGTVGSCRNGLNCQQQPEVTNFLHRRKDLESCVSRNMGDCKAAVGITSDIEPAQGGAVIGVLRLHGNRRAFDADAVLEQSAGNGNASFETDQMSLTDVEPHTTFGERRRLDRDRDSRGVARAIEEELTLLIGDCKRVNPAAGGAGITGAAKTGAFDIDGGGGNWFAVRIKDLADDTLRHGSAGESDGNEFCQGTAEERVDVFDEIGSITGCG